MIEDCIVTGIPRSGTSLTAGLIRLAGDHHFGNTIPGNKNNPKGFNESSEIRNSIVKPYLRACNVDPNGQWPLPGRGDLRPYPSLKEEVMDIMGESPWAIKEPKILLMWERWSQAFPGAKWVATERDPDEVLDSVVRTGFMKAFKNKHGWGSWLAIHQDRLDSLIANTDCFVFKPSVALSGDMSHVYDLGSHLGVKIPHKASQELLEPSLWTSPKGNKNK